MKEYIVEVIQQNGFFVIDEEDTQYDEVIDELLEEGIIEFAEGSDDELVLV